MSADTRTNEELLDAARDGDENGVGVLGVGGNAGDAAADRARARDLPVGDGHRADGGPGGAAERDRQNHTIFQRLEAQADKGTYLAAQYRRLAKRRGCKRALVAVGHTLLVIIYHVQKRGTTYAKLGADFLERLEPERLTRQLVKRLEALGHKVTLEPCPAA
jgi:hypothetical protein